MASLKRIAAAVGLTLLPYAAWLSILASRLLQPHPLMPVPAPAHPLPLCGRPAGDPPGQPPASLTWPDARVREATREWPVTDLPLDPWREIRTPRLRVRSDLPLADLRRDALILDAVAEGLAEDGLAAEEVHVRLYRRRRQLAAHASAFGVPDAVGLYDADAHEVLLAAEGLTLRAAAHELTHGLLHSLHDTVPPPWLGEGAAESAAGRLLRRWGLPDDDPPRDPPDLRRMDYGEWNSGDAATRLRRYAWARALFEREIRSDVGETYSRLLR